jgi:uncharacterized repeat protein (TIGR01451 family)
MTDNINIKSVDKAITVLAVILGVLSNRLTNSNKTFLRHRQGKLGGRAAFLIFILMAALIVTSPAAIAANGDFSIDFVAASPHSYNHLIGGGAYDDRTIGTDVVESLVGSDFGCGDIMTYFATVTVDDTYSAIEDQPQTIEMDFSFLADTTGASGVAIGDIVLVQVNYGEIQDLIAGENTTDEGNIDDGGSTATLVYENLTGPLFQSGSELHGTVQLDDLEAGEQVVVRIDVKLFGDPGSNPTGNLAGALTGARLTYINDNVAVYPPEAISGGEQTIPFKQIGDLGTPELEIHKTVTTSDGTCPGSETLTVTSGDTVKYCYVVTNPGSAPLYNMVLFDDSGTPGNTDDDFTVTLSLLTDVDNDGSLDDLAAGGMATGEALLTLYNVGTFINTGTVEGDDSIVEPTTLSANDIASVTVEGIPSIDVVKTSDATGTNQVGDVITYTYTVTNDGDVTLTDVTVVDTPDGPATLGVTTLAPGEKTTRTLMHTVTQADLDAGSRTNTADAEGTDPAGVVVTDQDTLTVTFAQNPSIDVVKTSDATGTNQVGDVITYTYTVTNDGDVTLTDITVVDTPDGPVTLGVTTLAPGEQTSGALQHTVTQADLDTGSRDNIADASGTDPAGVVVTDQDTLTVLFAQNPSIDVVKISDATGTNQVGDVITYTYTVTNDGDVTLTDVTVVDTPDGPVTLGTTTLAPGASTNGMLTHTVTQADLDAGSRTNTADAEGTDPAGVVVTDQDTLTVLFAQNPSIDVVKISDATGTNQVGDVITYTYTVKNEGDVTLTDITVVDTPDGPVTLGVTTLAPGEQTSGALQHTVTQADLDTGSRDNIADASGTDPAGVVVTDQDTLTVLFAQNPSIDVVKISDATGTSQVGDVITYTYTVTNDGDVTLTGVAVVDTPDGPVTLGTSTLAPGTSTNGMLKHTVTQADLDAGSRDNIADASGTDPNGSTVTNQDTLTVTFAQNPSISITKSGTWNDGNSDGYADVGETINYSYTVTNDGTVTLDAMNVIDSLGITVSCLDSELVPNESTTCIATYAIDQDDINAGEVYNLATATGTDPKGNDVSDEAEATVSLPQNPSIDVEKYVSIDNGATWVDADDPTGAPYMLFGTNPQFKFVVTNIGNVDLTGISLTDSDFDLSGCTVPPLLAVGASFECIVIDPWNVVLHTNTAKATGIPPIGANVTDTDDANYLAPSHSSP